MANPKQARMTARALEVRISKASLRRIGRSLKFMRSLLPALSNHSLGKQQQPGTDLDLRRFRCIQVDSETNIVLVEDKADHSTSTEKTGALSYGQNRSVVQIRQQRRNALTLRA